MPSKETWAAFPLLSGLRNGWDFVFKGHQKANSVADHANSENAPAKV